MLNNFQTVNVTGVLNANEIISDNLRATSLAYKNPDASLGTVNLVAQPTTPTTNQVLTIAPDGSAFWADGGAGGPASQIANDGLPVIDINTIDPSLFQQGQVLVLDTPPPNPLADPQSVSWQFPYVLGNSSSPSGVTLTTDASPNQLLLSTTGSTAGWGSRYVDDTVVTTSLAIGTGALQNVTTGINNAAVGQNVLTNVSTGRQNTALGIRAGFGLTTGLSNVLVGYSAAESLTNGQDNTAIGSSALENISGNENTAVGSLSLINATSGDGNVALGYKAGVSQTAYDHCTFIGTNSDATVNELQNATAIGNGAQVSASNAMALGSDITGVSVGINLAQPKATLHIGQNGNAGGECSVMIDSSLVIPAPPSVGSFVGYINPDPTGGDLRFRNEQGSEVSVISFSRAPIASNVLYNLPYLNLDRTYGEVTLAGGTKTISSSYVLTDSKILLTRSALASEPVNTGSILTYTVNAGGGQFTISSFTSTGTSADQDNGKVTWFVLNGNF